MSGLKARLKTAILATKQRLRRLEGRLVIGEKLPAGLESYGLRGRQVFFGYYDVTPFDAVNKRLLAMSAPNHNRMPRVGERADVGYFTRGEPGRFHKIGETSAWCWQQGCRLQWFPRAEGGRNNRVIYNVANDSGFGSVVRDSESGEEIACFDRALYDIAADGSYGLNLDFHRLGVYRPGYGYACALPDPTLNDPVPASSTISRVDLATGKGKELISLADVATMDPEPSMEGATHYLNHVSISPDGGRFLFYHFWNSGTEKNSRVCLADADGGNLRRLALGNNPSHFAWNDGRTLLFYCKPFGGERKYWTVHIERGLIESIEDDQMLCDGHPSILAGGEAVITDTYPNGAGYQSLLLHEQKRRSTRVLARLYSPIAYSMEMRCDLHPRLSQDGKWVSVDSARDGKRALYVMPLERVP